MKKTMRIVSLLLALMLLFAVPALAEKKKAKKVSVVSAKVVDGATLLSKPRADGETVATLSAGDEVKVSVVGLAWCKAVSGDKEGYVASKLITFSDAESNEAFAVVSAKNGRLTLRQKDSTKSKALGKFNNGSVAAVLEKGDKFTKVAIAGKEGYLLTDHLTFSAAQEGEGVGTIVWPEKTKGVRKIKLRWSEKSGGNVVATVETGTDFVLLEKGDDWSKIEVNGKVGYMMTKYLDIEEAVSAPSGTLPIGAPAAPAQQPAAQPSQQPAAQPAQQKQGVQPTAAPKATAEPTQEPGEYVNDGNMEPIE